MEEIRGYVYDAKKGKVSPNGKYYKAQKDGKNYFLKRFTSIKYPIESVNPKNYRKLKKSCDEWLKNRNEIINALKELGDGTGNIVSPREIFREKMSFYQVSHWVDVATCSLKEVSEFPEEKKIMLLKTYAAALKKIHSKNIIHGDLKPENVIIGRSGSGNPVAKFIDFDDSYFSGRALDPDDTIVTDAYQSPELAAYKMGDTKVRSQLTCASDVFASAIIFHQFWTGNMPEYPGKEAGHYLFETVITGKGYRLDPSIPKWLQRLIRAMLDINPKNRPTMEEVHKALIEEKFEKEGIDGTEKIDRSVLDKVIQMVPKDMSVYTEDSAKNLSHAIDQAASILKEKNIGQSQINQAAKMIFLALRGLEEKKNKKETVVEKTDYTEVKKAMARIPKDLSGYTKQSVDVLQKVIAIAQANQHLENQSDVDKLAAYLNQAIRKLTVKSFDGLVPVSPLPEGYENVQILPNGKVRVRTSSGSTVTLPGVSAKAMGLVK